MVEKTKRPYRFKLSLEDWKARHRLSEASRAKMSASLRGRSLSPEHCQKLSAAHKGRVFSLERNKKIASSLRGHATSVTTRAKIRAALLGRKLSREHRQNIAAGGVGRKPSDATRRRLRAAQQARSMTQAWLDHLARLSAANKGRKLSAEHRASISRAHTARPHAIEHVAKVREACRRRRESGTGYAVRCAARYTSLARKLHAILASDGLILEPEVRFGPYTVDLYDRAHHVAYEADGRYWHELNEAARPGYYARRDAYLTETHGLRVVRFDDTAIKAMTVKTVA